MIPADLIGLLRCPQSGQPLIPAGSEVLDQVNDRLSRAAVPDGSTHQPVTEGLLRLDKLLLYPIRDGIPVLLAEEAISL